MAHQGQWFFPEVLGKSLCSTIQGKVFDSTAKTGQRAGVLSTWSHSQERHLVDSREPGCQVMTRLYSLPVQTAQTLSMPAR